MIQCIHRRFNESKVGDPEFGERFCVWKTKKQVDGLVEPVEELCEEVETVSKNWVGEVQGMRSDAEPKKVLA